MAERIIPIRRVPGPTTSRERGVEDRLEALTEPQGLGGLGDVALVAPAVGLKAVAAEGVDLG